MQHQDDDLHDVHSAQGGAARTCMDRHRQLRHICTEPSAARHRRSGPGPAATEKQRAWEHECAKGNELGVFWGYFTPGVALCTGPLRVFHKAPEKSAAWSVEWSAPQPEARIPSTHITSQPAARIPPWITARAPASQFQQGSASQYLWPKVQI